MMNRDMTILLTHTLMIIGKKPTERGVPCLRIRHHLLT